MEELVRNIREELFDKTLRVNVTDHDNEMAVNSAEIINNFRKRKFDIETEKLISEVYDAEAAAKIDAGSKEELSVGEVSK